jgi:site-specific DNA recombinase
VTGPAAIYCRLSKDTEGRQVGVGRQQEDCEELAARLNLEVAHVFVDNDAGASSLSKKKRSGYQELMKLAEAGAVDVIIAYSNSRLTRRPMELEDLIRVHDRTGVEFKTVVSGNDDLSTADGRMVARIKASVDAAEAERIGERTRRAKQQGRENGDFLGGWRRYGLEADGKTVRAGEAAVIQEAAHALLDGVSLTGFVRKLNAAGIGTATGRPFLRRDLQRILLRGHPSLGEDVAIAVRHLLTNPDRRTTPGPARRWLLSGIARCGECGGTLHGSGSSLGRGKGTYSAYKCATGKHVVINAVALDGFIGEVVTERLRTEPDVLAPPGADTSALRLEAAALRLRLDALADDLALDERTLQRRARALQARIDEIEARITVTVRRMPLAAGRDPDEVWESATLDQRRMILGLLIEDIVIRRGRRGRVPLEERWRPELAMFDPGRVDVTWR